MKKIFVLFALAILFRSPAHGAAPAALVVGQDCAGRNVCTFTVWETSPDGEPALLYQWQGPPVELALEGAFDLNGNLILVDGWSVQVIAPDGSPLRAPDFRREYLGGVTVDNAGAQWISVFNFGKERLRKFDSGGSRELSRRNSRAMISIDLDADQCSMLYSGGTADPVVRRYNVCAGQPMQDLGTLPKGTVIRQVRHLPGDDALAVTPGALIRIGPAGQEISRVSSPDATQSWRAISLLEGKPEALVITSDTLWHLDLDTGATLSEPMQFASERLVGVFAIGEWRAAVSTPGRPAAPSNLRVTWHSDGRHLLEWVDNSRDEEYFTIEYSVNGERFRELGRIDKDLSAVTVRGWDPMRYYRFRVRAWNAVGASGYSNEKSFWD